MQETLICQATGHKWARERKRGVKPKLCPEHKGAILSSAEQQNNSDKGAGRNYSSDGAERLSEPVSVVSNEALELLTSDDYLDPEFSRKLEYCVTELERGRVDTHDVTLLTQTRDRLMALHARSLQR